MGLSPYAMDLNLKKTTRQTTRQTTNFSSTGGAISYDATVPNFALNDTHTNRFSTDGGDRLAVAIAAAADAEYLCREGAVPDTTGDDDGGGTHPPDIISLFSYDETTDLTGSLSQLLTNTPPTAIGASTSDQAEAALRCKAFFAADLSTSSTSTSDEESSKTQSLQGTGIEFGYDFEKYSLSFNQLQWSGGDDKLQAQMLLIRYFLAYAHHWAGVSIGAKLDTEFGSDSGTSPPFFILQYGFF